MYSRNDLVNDFQSNLPGVYCPWRELLLKCSQEGGMTKQRRRLDGQPGIGLPAFDSQGGLSGRRLLEGNMNLILAPLLSSTTQSHGDRIARARERVLADTKEVCTN